MDAQTLPAWYGKLPSLGDFASRRMDPALLELWDAWLAQGLMALQAQHLAAGTSWLDAYLVSPSWQFLLTPGCLPGPLAASAWIGCLMPSVDRVGRYFPFTLIQPMAQLPGTLAAWQHLQARLQLYDDLAADALEQDWSLERLEHELSTTVQRSAAAAPAWSATPVRPGSGPGVLVDWPGNSPRSDPICDEALQLWIHHGAAGRSFWKARSQDGLAQQWRLCEGLPAQAALLLGAS